MKDKKTYLVIGMLVLFSIIIFINASEKLNNSILHWILLGGLFFCFGWLIWDSVIEAKKK